jgi:hypothetical protein
MLFIKRKLLVPDTDSHGFIFAESALKKWDKGQWDKGPFPLSQLLPCY